MSYSLYCKLRSCKVTHQLLRDLETYLLSLPERLMPDRRSVSYGVEMEDSIGTETLQSVDEFKFHIFPNDIRKVKLVMRGSATSIDIVLAVEAISSRLSVYIDGENAREIARGIQVRVDDIIRPLRSLNFLFAVDLSVWFIIGFVLIQVIVFSGVTFLRAQGVGIGGAGGQGISIVIGVAAFLLCSYLRPYTEFDTNLNRTKSRVFWWLVGTVMTAFITGLIVNWLSRKWR